MGGTNPYGEPNFKLVWSTEPRIVYGGKWDKDGFEGYREVKQIHGTPSWALMVWESPEMMGSPERWEQDYRDPETGYLQIVYPRHGRYRLVQKFEHTEVVETPEERHWMMKDGTLCRDIVRTRKTETTRMEPCGVLLDLMMPMLIRWHRLTDRAKIAALKQEEELRDKEMAKMAKDAREGCRISRGSRLVAERAEQIERGFRQAMQVAAQSGLGQKVAQASF